MKKMQTVFLFIFICTIAQAQNESAKDTLSNDINVKLVTIGPGS